MNNSQPIDTLRAGAIKACLWLNQNQRGEPYLTVSFAKTYRDGSGKLADTTAFVGTDVLTLSYLANKAFERSHEIRQQLISERAEPDMFDDEPAQQSNRSQARRQNTRAPQ